MEAEFWHQKWSRGDIGFHQSQVNVYLTTHFKHLQVAAGNRIFLPLCGKTLDIAWLLSQGVQVVGAELSEMAIQELFESLNVTPNVVAEGRHIRYSAPGLDIFVGDIFELSPQQIGLIDGIYDRAALVALPSGMRRQYAVHLITLSHSARQLLISYEYDQSQIDGPPFSVTDEEIQQLYGSAYSMIALERKAVEGGMKGKVPAMETCWVLEPNHQLRTQ